MSLALGRHIKRLVDLMLPTPPPPAPLPDKPAVAVPGVPLSGVANAERQYLDGLIDHVHPAPTPHAPPRIVNGTTVQKGARESLEQMYTAHQQYKPVTQTLEDDVLLARTAHVRRPSEAMGQFISRIGLGKAQILSMSAEEISQFVKVSEANTETWRPR